MSNNSEINWRDASEDEFEYIKKKYLSPMVAVTVGNAFVFLLIVATVAFLIYCNTKKHDIGAIICSVFVYIVMLILMVAVICLISTDIRRLSCISRRKFLVADASVQNVNVQMRSRGRTSATIQFLTSSGVRLSMKSTGLEPLAQKGRRALILYFGRSDKKDWQYVVKEL